MTLTDLRDKEEVDVTEGRIVAIILPGKLKWFGLLGRGEDCQIPWEKIDIIGADLILVQHDATQTLPRKRRRKNFF